MILWNLFEKKFCLKFSYKKKYKLNFEKNNNENISSKNKNNKKQCFYKIHKYKRNMCTNIYTRRRS